MNEMLPKISIVTPSYNQATYLEDTILSVLDQRYPYLELIIIDGGSDDGSVDIIKRYSDRIAYWDSQPDGGQYEAINRGFAKATGDILCWINSDDKHCPWALRVVGEVFQQLPEVKWLTSRYPLNWSPDGVCCNAHFKQCMCRESILDGRHILNDSLYLGWVQQESTFWRRELWEQVGRQLNQEFSLAADTDLWLRMAERADLHLCNTPLAGFRLNPQQRSRVFADEYVRQAGDALAQSALRMGRRSSSGSSLRLRRLVARAPFLGRFCAGVRYRSKIVSCEHRDDDLGRKWFISEEAW